MAADTPPSPKRSPAAAGTRAATGKPDAPAQAPAAADRPHGPPAQPFVLLDDGDATAAQPSSRLYTGFVREHRCTDPDTLEAVCAAAQADLAAGLHAVLLADYEWGAKLLRAGHERLGPRDAACLRVLVFDSLARLDEAAVAHWLARLESGEDAQPVQTGAVARAGATVQPDAARTGTTQASGSCHGSPSLPPAPESVPVHAPAPAGVLDLWPDTSRAAFEAAIARIHEAIRAGETYQVNYTYRLHGRAWGSPVALYRRLRTRQRVGFGALARLPMQDGDTVRWVLSRSPELLVRHERGRLQTRPMKGTAPRASAPEGDSETARLLHGDIKNRAENLMIVDLLRNDLGRIAQVGSVRVPQLFSVEPYATVFQMTSTIEARRRADVGLAELLRAVFPCGSITGAPKHRTMQWIAQLEPAPRGLYTGAIGWLEHGDGACPDLCLSVAIRTLALGAEPRGRRSAGLRPFVLGVGGGIVHDSVAADEYEETRWKAGFLTRLDPGVALFETMRATAAGIAHRARHRARLAASARALGFAFDAQAFDAALDAALGQLRPTLHGERAARLRVQLSHDGSLAVTHAPLDPLPAGPVRLLLAEAPLPPARPLSAHKTTLRAEYDAGIRAAEAAGAFDTLFFDAADRLVEGGRTSVFVRLHGRWCTPPLADGALPGILRGVLLADAAWDACVRRIHRAELLRAEAIVVCNALRGALPAVLDRTPGRASPPSRLAGGPGLPTRLDDALGAPARPE